MGRILWGLVGVLLAAASTFFFYYSARIVYLFATGQIKSPLPGGLMIGIMVFPVATFVFGWGSQWALRRALPAATRSPSESD